MEVATKSTKISIKIRDDNGCVHVQKIHITEARIYIA